MVLLILLINGVDGVEKNDDGAEVADVWLFNPRTVDLAPSKETGELLEDVDDWGTADLSKKAGA